MMNIFSFLFFFFITSAYAEISKKELMDSLREFIKTSAPKRIYGEPGHLKAHDFILSWAQKYSKASDSETIDHEFVPEISAAKAMYQQDWDNFLKSGETNFAIVQKYKKFTEQMHTALDQLKDKKMKNIIWKKKGKNPKKFLVLMAHFDTVSHDKNTLLIKQNENMPGADYNGTGVMILLRLIQQLYKIELESNVEITFLDGSVFGFLGAREYVKDWKSRIKVDPSLQLEGVINLEMLGHDSKAIDAKKELGNMRVYYSQSPNSVQEINLIKSIQSHKKTEGVIKFDPSSQEFDQSDHIPFWEAQIPAITYTQNWEDDFNLRNYQTPQDLPETLNQDTFFNAYQYISSGVIGHLKTSTVVK